VAALVRDYAGKAVAQAVATFDPSPANIDAHTVRQTLPNGMELALLSKPTRGEAVNGTLVLHLGNTQSLQGKTAIGSLTAGMLDRGAARSAGSRLRIGSRRSRPMYRSRAVRSG
jgi:zinc protease